MRKLTEFSKHIPVGRAQKRLPELIRELEEYQQSIVLTRGGTPAAVLLSVEIFQGLLETIEILAKPKTLRSLRRSLKQAERGEWITRREIFDQEPWGKGGLGETLYRESLMPDTGIKHPVSDTWC